MVLSFPSPFLFPTGLTLKSMEEKELSISGTNEGPGPWRVDLVVQYYKIYLRKNSPGLPVAQVSAGPVARPLHVGVGQRRGREWLLGTGVSSWWSSIRFSLPCEHVHKHSPLPSALLCCKELAESKWQLGTKCSVRPVMGSSAVKSVIHLGPIFTQGQGKTRNFYLTL